MDTPLINEALDLLFSYQRKWVESDARFLAGVWSRQVGKSFATACIVAKSIVSKPNTEWLLAAPSERQSLESLDKVKKWLEAFNVLFIAELIEINLEKDVASCVVLDNGSRVFAVPGEPRTVRGFSANVWLDEFAFFKQPDETWKAIIPSITNPLTGGKKRAIITSTPNGKAGKGKRFYDICTAENSIWSVQRVPIKLAIADGLPVDEDELRAGLSDPQAARQELDAEFTDTQSQLLPTEMILRAERAEASMLAPADLYHTGRDLRLGVDVGRVTDPTVIYCVEKLADGNCLTREVVSLKNMSHADQLDLLRMRIKHCRQVALDYTGMGIGLGDILAKEFGDYNPKQHLFGKIERCTFTTSLKRDIFPKLRAAMEAQQILIPRDEQLRMDFAAMEQLYTGHEYTYEAPRTKDGHSDQCTAAALAVRAAEVEPQHRAYFTPVPC